MEQQKLLHQTHIKYIHALDSEITRETLEYWLSEHLRLNGVYWGTTALSLLGSSFEVDEITKFVESCFDTKAGGYGAFPGHDAHILSTLSAIQILTTYNVPIIHKEQVITYIKSLQLPNGAFQGDNFGEIDTRFVYVALCCLSILGELLQEVCRPATEFIKNCGNFDGGFGMVPGAESHAAQVLCCVAALKIAGTINEIDVHKTAQWLSERQVLPSGGLNGRPEKLPDVCYSWWVLSSLSILGKLHWVHKEKLIEFILSCQDVEGGFSDRPGNVTDVFHTCFGIAGLALIDHKMFNLEPVDPLYCMPIKITGLFQKLGN